MTAVPDDDPSQTDSHHHHGLEFEYDCDAPKCRISVNVILPADHPLAGNVDDSGFSRVPVYESVVDGGFGRVLKLEDGATLELDRFECIDRGDALARSAHPETPGATDGAEAGAGDRHRRRFSTFQFRKRNISRSASGPALTVVDADRTHTPDKERESKEDIKDGVRVIIRLSALDEDGIDTATKNEQVTYLHIVRLGAPPAESQEDTRPWVVRVVKRDAIVRHVPPVITSVRLIELIRRSVHMYFSFTRYTDSRLVHHRLLNNAFPRHPLTRTRILLIQA